MISITERLRARLEPIGDGSGKWRPDGLCQEAADINDALVAALEDALDLLDGLYPNPARNGEIARGRAALAKAKGKQE